MGIERSGGWLLVRLPTLRVVHTESLIGSHTLWPHSHPGLCQFSIFSLQELSRWSPAGRTNSGKIVAGVWSEEVLQAVEERDGLLFRVYQTAESGGAEEN